jgi:hypothetical protein
MVDSMLVALTILIAKFAPVANSMSPQTLEDVFSWYRRQGAVCSDYLPKFE